MRKAPAASDATSTTDHRRTLSSSVSNDLTRLTLGVDRDSTLVAGSLDEFDPAVLALMERAFAARKTRGKHVGIYGQGPSGQAARPEDRFDVAEPRHRCWNLDPARRRGLVSSVEDQSQSV